MTTAKEILVIILRIVFSLIISFAVGLMVTGLIQYFEPGVIAFGVTFVYLITRISKSDP